MPQILNTGAGLYQTVKDSSYDPIDEVRRAGAIEAQLVETKYKVRKEREAEFLKTMDKETGKFMFGQLQTEAVKRLKKAQEDSAEIYRLSGENPTLEDNIKISNIMRDFEGWRDERLAFSKQYSEMSQLHNEDRGRTFDFDKSQEQLTYAQKNPLTATMSPFPPRVKSIDEAFNGYYEKIGANKWNKSDIKRNKDANGNVDTWAISSRDGFETDEQSQRQWEQALETDTDIKIIGHDKWNLLNDNQKEGYIKKYGQANAYKGFMTEQYYPIFSRKKEDKIDSSGWNVKDSGGSGAGTGGKGKFGYMTQNALLDPIAKTENKGIVLSEAASSNGIPISFSGKILDAQGNVIKTTKDDILVATGLFNDKVTGQLLKGSKTVDNSIDKNKYTDKLNASMVGNVWQDIDNNQRTTIQNPDGSFSISVALAPQDAYIDMTNATNASDVYTQLKFRTKDKDFETKAKSHFGSVSSQPKQSNKKQIKRGDIKSKADAAGYSVDEYTKMLQKNEVEIVD